MSTRRGSRYQKWKTNKGGKNKTIGNCDLYDDLKITTRKDKNLKRKRKKRRGLLPRVNFRLKLKYSRDTKVMSKRRNEEKNHIHSTETGSRQG